MKVCIKDDSIAIYKSPHLVGSFFPLNAKSVSIYIKTDDILTKNKCDSLANDIETTLKDFKFDDIHFVGRIFAQNVYLKNLQKEFIIFICLSFVVIVIFLWFSFRSLYGIVVPVVIVLISILWTLGVNETLRQINRYYDSHAAYDDLYCWHERRGAFFL